MPREQSCQKRPRHSGTPIRRVTAAEVMGSTPEGGAGASAALDVIWKLAHLEQPPVQERAQDSMHLTLRLIFLCAVQTQESAPIVMPENGSWGGAARSRLRSSVDEPLVNC